jgi:hypothetical protein
LTKGGQQLLHQQVSRDLAVVVDHDDCVSADDIDIDIDGLSAHFRFHLHLHFHVTEVINEDDAEDNLYAAAAAAAAAVPNKNDGDPSTVRRMKVEEEKADGRRRHRVVPAAPILVLTVVVVRIDDGAAEDAAANAVACDTDGNIEMRILVTTWFHPHPLEKDCRLYNTAEDSNCIRIVIEVVVDEETLEVLMEVPMK